MRCVSKGYVWPFDLPQTFSLLLLLVFSLIFIANGQVTITPSEFGTIGTSFDKTPPAAVGNPYIIFEGTAYTSGNNSFGTVASLSFVADKLGNFVSSSESNTDYAYFEFDLSGAPVAATNTSLSFQLDRIIGNGGSANILLRGNVSNPGTTSTFTYFDDLGGFQIASGSLSYGDPGSILTFQFNQSALNWINSNVGATFTIAATLTPTVVSDNYNYQADFRKSAGSLPFLTFNDPAAVPEPSTYAVVLGALAVGLISFRRWKMKNDGQQL